MTVTEAWVYFPETDTRAVFTVRDSWVDFDTLDSIQLKPFETANQAIQRVYGSCEIYMRFQGQEPLLINSPGNREWMA